MPAIAGNAGVGPTGNAGELGVLKGKRVGFDGDD
jgi:hypothetical protein